MKKRILTSIILLVLLLSSCTTDTHSTDSNTQNNGTTPSSDQTTQTVTQPSTEKMTEEETKPSSEQTAEDNTQPPAVQTTPPASEEPSTTVKLISDITKPDNTNIKVACVGDSITAGSGITDKDTNSYPARLGSMLGSGYEVANFGIGGSYILPADHPYNKRQDKTLSYRDTQQYKDSVKFSPDVVIIMLGTNDALSSMLSKEAVDAVEQEYVKLINSYKELDSVKRVYVVSSPLSVLNIGSSMLTDGTLQKMQENAAKKTESEFVNAFPLVREYYDTMLHTSDRLHPNDRCVEVLPSVIHSLITGTDYTVEKAPISENKVVYVSNAGKKTNDGLTPNTPVNSIPLAAGMLREDGGTIVICGDYTCYKQSGTLMPKTNGTITVTSVHNGTDYKKTSGARISLTSTYLYLGGDTVFDNITINSIASSIIVCNYNNVTFSDSVECTVESKAAYPIILAGMNVAHGAIEHDAVSLNGECNITVNSGKWGYIRGGNRRADKGSTVGDIAKGAKLTITINGAEIMTVATQNINAATGMNNVHGEVNFILNEGIVHGDLYAVCRLGTNQTSDKAEVSGKINITVNGGEIKGKLAKTQDTSFDTSNADITLTVKKSAKDGISSIVGFDNIIEAD